MANAFSDVRRKELRKFAQRVEQLIAELPNYSERRRDQLSAFGVNSKSFIVGALTRESLVHLTVISKITTLYAGDLHEWLALANPERLDDPAVKLAAEEAFSSLEECKELIAASEVKQILKLAYIISAKAAAVFGFGWVSSLMEVMENVRTLDEIVEIQYSDEKTAEKVIGGLELFMMSSLVACSTAIITTEKLTGRLKGNYPTAAKAIVIGAVHKTRQDYSRIPPIAGLIFPNDGFWSELVFPTRPHNTTIEGPPQPFG